jgi:release factor glutamine methyltransferase
MCTGSGCIAVALAQAFPKATVYAVDNNPEALKLTKENALLNNCTNIITVESDLFENLNGLTFDCIVSNPPYVTEEEWETLDPVVKNWEDPHALVSYDYGLGIIKKIITEAAKRLNKDPEFAQREVPQLLLEIGETQGVAVADLMLAAGFVPTIHQDDAGKDRFVTGVLTGVHNG